MEQTKTLLDPKFAKLENGVKFGGALVIAAAVSTVITAVGLSVITATAVGVPALACVYLVIPYSARRIALWRQKAMTALAETFSEETIREDERLEGERIEQLEEQYKISRSELEGAQDELQKQMKDATEEEQAVLNSQIVAMQQVIQDAEEVLRTRLEDFKELKRVNKLYIALHRSAVAMEKSQGTERNAKQIQDIETARNAIKTKMRSALAGKTVEAMAHHQGSKLLDVTPNVFVKAIKSEKQRV